MHEGGLAWLAQVVGNPHLGSLAARQGPFNALSSSVVCSVVARRWLVELLQWRPRRYPARTGLTRRPSTAPVARVFQVYSFCRLPLASHIYISYSAQLCLLGGDWSLYARCSLFCQAESPHKIRTAVNRITFFLVKSPQMHIRYSVQNLAYYLCT
jgi:hypothetical protein